MDKIANFKEFVKKNPALTTFVNNNTMTWQKFYEMYDLYGENNDIWKDYLERTDTVKAIGLADVIAWIKNIDLDTLKENINNVQRVVGVLQDLGTKNTSTTYNPRPIFKHFED